MIASNPWEAFGWTAARSRSGGAKAVGTEAHAGRSLYGKDAERALAGKRRGDKPAAAQVGGDPGDEDAARPAAGVRPAAPPRQPRGPRKLTVGDIDRLDLPDHQKAAAKTILFAAAGDRDAQNELRSQAAEAATAALGPVAAGAIEPARLVAGVREAMPDADPETVSHVARGLTDIAAQTDPAAVKGATRRFIETVVKLGAKAGGAVARGLFKFAAWGIRSAAGLAWRGFQATVVPPLRMAATYGLPAMGHLATLAGFAGAVAALTLLPAAIGTAGSLMVGAATAVALRVAIKRSANFWGGQMFRATMSRVHEGSPDLPFYLSKPKPGDSVGNFAEEAEFTAFGWRAEMTRKHTTKAVGTGEHEGRTEYGDRAKRLLAAQGKSAPDAGPVPAAPTSPAPEAAAPAGPPPEPQQALADAIADRFRRGQGVTARELFGAADRAFGGTRAAGAYGVADAYDSLEAGFNAALRDKTDPRLDLADAQAQAAELAAAVAALPTQTNRGGNKDSFQQFSTPPHYAYAATWLANLTAADVVLEPSAGTASLAVHAANSGADVYANEYDPKRAALLASIVGADKVSGENAEQIAAILAGRIPQPTAVVMNPPFSQTAGRMGTKTDTMVGANHIDEAMRMLADGGRLVAIVGRGMGPWSKTFAPWFRGLAAKGYTLRGNVGIHGNEYTKSGTSFGTRVLVIDKVAGGPAAVTGDATDIPNLMEMLDGVRTDRPAARVGAPGQPARGGPAEGAGALPAAGGNAAGATGDALFAGGGAAGPGAGGVGAGGDQAAGGPVAAGAGLRPARRGLRGAAVAVVGDPLVGAGPGTQPDPGEVAGGGRGSPSGQPGVQRPAGLPRLRPAELARLKPRAESADTGPAELGDSMFGTYVPSANVEGSVKHASPLVESAAMAAVNAPEATYTPMLSPDLITSGALSDAALDSVVYAGQAHEQMLEPQRTATGEYLPAERRGYFIGDGTGAGKGRQIAGIITDNWNRGRKKAVWVSLKPPLLEDARRDWRDVGNDPAAVLPFDKVARAVKPPKEGVAFVTYDTLKSRPTDASKPSNVDELIKWLGPDFDGVIAFDEAHAMSNAMPKKGPRGMTEGSGRATAGVELQRRLPNARVVYVSATGATEVSNLAYADRLGIWGRGTAFSTKQEFVNEMDAGGVASMEAVAQSLKAQGSYSARSLSFDDGTPNGKVTYDRVLHKLTGEQRAMYDTAADGWQAVLQNIDKALAATGGDDSPQAKSNAKSQFWGGQLRFFDQFMTSMQTPSVIRGIEQDLADGKSPVVQLVNTNEAPTSRAIAKAAADGGDDYDHIDVSPRQILSEYLNVSFPTSRYEKYVDEDGNTKSRPVVDAKGNEVLDPAAVRMRDDLLDMVGALRIPAGPLDQIIDHFGADKVAEATGRTERLVNKVQADGTTRKEPEKRNSAVANLAEATAFQSGKKRIMVFSDAGGTGRSYHADKNAANQQQRIHYMLQPGWRADAAVQGLGRTHRTNQASAPVYKLVSIEELKGQKRFVSTIARRLDQLGAITKGQRDTGSAGLFKASDNMEGREAVQALDAFFADLKANRIEGLDADKTLKSLGFKIDDDDKDGGSRRKKVTNPPMTQFLNRLLSLRVEDSNKVFDAYDERLAAITEQAARNGTLNEGVENFKATRVVPTEDRVVYKDPASGAEVRLLSTTVTKPVYRTPFTRTAEGTRPLKFLRNRASGMVRAAYTMPDRTETATGRVVAQYAMLGPTGKSYLDASVADFSNKYELISAQDAEPLWGREYDEAPSSIDSVAHFVTGALLPVWNKLPKGDQQRFYRVKPEGRRAIVGRVVSDAALPKMLADLGQSAPASGAAGPAAKLDPAAVHGRLSLGTAKAKLAGGWDLKPVRIQNERRIELIGVGPYDMRSVEADGVIRERIGGYDTRFFVPTGAAGVEVLRRLTLSRGIVSVDDVGQAAKEFGESPHEAFGWDDWSPADGNTMKSPGGRVLSKPVFDRLSRGGPAGGAGEQSRPESGTAVASGAGGAARIGYRTPGHAEKPTVRFPDGWEDQSRHGPNPLLPNATRPPLPLEAAEAAYAYSGTTVHAAMNKRLNAGLSVSKKYAELHAVLAAAIDGAEPFWPPVEVTRVIDATPAVAARLYAHAAEALAGDGDFSGHMRGYQSTTAAGPGRTAGLSGNVLLTIQATHGLDLLPYSDSPDEYELLLPPSSGYTVTAVDKAVVAGQVEYHVALTQRPRRAAVAAGREPAPKTGRVYELPPSRIVADPARFQFKLDTDKSGVTAELKGVKTFNPDFAGVIAVWHDPADGKTYVVNGHHRLDLAKRAGTAKIAVRYLNAGTAAEARAKGALINIAEGRGTAVDAAKFLRDTGRTVADLAAVGVSQTGALARDAGTLAKLDDALFNRVARGSLELDRALAVAAAVPGHAEQRQVVAAVEAQEAKTGRPVGAKVVNELAREVALAPRVQGAGDLFGDGGDESAWMQRAELKAFVRANLTRTANDFRAVSSSRRADALAGTANVLDLPANRAAADATRGLLDDFDQLVNLKGGVSDALNTLAAEYANADTAQSRQAVRGRAVAAVRAAVSAG